MGGHGCRDDVKPDFYGNDESGADRMSGVDAGNSASSPVVILKIGGYFTGSNGPFY